MAKRLLGIWDVPIIILFLGTNPPIAPIPVPYKPIPPVHRFQTMLIQSQSAPENTERIKFRIVQISDGPSDDGTWWKMFDLLTSEGHRVYTQKFPYKSKGHAHKAFHNNLKWAEKVIRREPELGENGRVVGERVLALFPKDDRIPMPPDNQPHYVLFWTAGSGLTKLSENI